MLDNPPLDAALPLIVNFATPRKVALRKLSASLARKRAVECRETDLPPPAQDVGATLRPLLLPAQRLSPAELRPSSHHPTPFADRRQSSAYPPSRSSAPRSADWRRRSSAGDRRQAC